MTLNGNQLGGTLPSSLSTLTAVSRVVASYNQLIGSIPDSVSVLTTLVIFDVSSNRLFSTFPSPIVALKRLTFLDISSNAFIGTVPSELSALSLLTYVSPLLTPKTNGWATGSCARRGNECVQVRHCSILQQPTVQHDPYSGSDSPAQHWSVVVAHLRDQRVRCPVLLWRW